MTTQRNRLWTNTDLILNVTAADAAGQVSQNLTTNLQTGLGIPNLAGYTCVRTFVRGFVQSDGDNTTAGTVFAHWGIGVYAGGIDNGDFPDLSLYDGDWLAYGSLVFRNPGVALNIVEPERAGYVQMDSKSARRLDRIGDTMFFVVQQSTAQDFLYNLSVSQLWLMP